MSTIEHHVNTMRTMGLKEKQSYLNRLLGHHDNEPSVLSFRAHLMSALKVAKVWPPVVDD